jgi:hypothetical protein
MINRRAFLGTLGAAPAALPAPGVAPTRPTLQVWSSQFFTRTVLVKDGVFYHVDLNRLPHIKAMVAAGWKPATPTQMELAEPFHRHVEHSIFHVNLPAL